MNVNASTSLKPYLTSFELEVVEGVWCNGNDDAIGDAVADDTSRQ